MIRARDIDREAILLRIMKNNPTADSRSASIMKYGVMESFSMYNTKTMYGLTCGGDRGSLFQKAGDLGFQGIEFGIDLDYRIDPLWTGEGDLRKTMREAAQATGVEAASICLHLLNYQENSPASDKAEHRRIAGEIIRNTIEACAHIGASVTLVPFFGTASIKKEDQIQNLIIEMKKLAPAAEERGICLALETSLNALDLVRIVDSIGSDCVQVYYDTGNAASKGYDIVAEIEKLRERIVQVHIKDKPNGTLGAGNIDFPAVLEAFDRVGFDGYLILETPSTDDSFVGARINLEYIMSVTESPNA